MARRNSSRADQVRHALAQEAARIMAEHGVEDFLFAKRKAAERLGVVDAAVLPKNTEIEQALVEYQRLFDADNHPRSLERQRRAALATMRLLRAFDPRLVGPVLTGTATQHNDISLHLFADSPESVAIALIDHGIPHDVIERRLRMDAERIVSCPGVRFQAGEHAIEAMVFPRDGIRQSPCSPVDGRPMRRADRDELQALIDVPGGSPVG
jgi:hypothetical protein